MKAKLQKAGFIILSTLAGTWALGFSAFAGMLNPATGDTQGQYLGIVVGALAVSLVVIIIVLAVSSKKKKKKK